MPRIHWTFSALALSSLLLGCATDADDGPSPFDDEFPTSDHGSLFDDVPGNDTLPDDNKADAVYPVKFIETIRHDSQVKSQGGRGVCSIFSTTALMEHLYNKEGTLQNPDFSEQYLQWSAKVQVGRFPHTSGSNASANLQAINRYGIVTEEVMPYETSPWNESNDPECTGDEMPTRCYTNGDPTQEQQNARKYKLPRGRWINTNSIKAHMTAEKTGVVVGMTFFYQSWNHRKSPNPINSEYWRQGYVTYPNEKDKEHSLENRAGHSILLVGWDDDLEVQKRDGEGTLLVDDNGDPIMEKGFYIFKNSWGTGSFGVDNPHGDGYGFVSMDYVHEYGSAYVSGVPTVEVPREICGDGEDNDDNGATDCDDEACADELECQEDLQTHTFTSDESVAIPDNDVEGVATAIDVEQTGTVARVTVTPDIQHTYRGDLRVILYRGSDAVVLHDRTGAGADDLNEPFSVEDFNGTDMAGEWRLAVEDRAPQDSGSLNGWTLEILAN